MTRPSLAVALAGMAALAEAGDIRIVNDPVPDSYVVALKPGLAARPGEPGPTAGELAARLTAMHGGRVTFVYEHALSGFAASMPEGAARALADDPRVEYVEQDGIVHASGTQIINPPTTASPWGLDRTDQRRLPLSSTFTFNQTGAGVRAYILDSGIRATHREFDIGRVHSGFTSVNDGNGTTDCNGHGTHVAGTLGGSTYGVAKQVALYPVRVLDCRGNGSTSGVIAGIDWVTANHVKPAVANMSLGGSASLLLDLAVQGSIDAGVTYVVAAGNANSDACLGSPGRLEAALTAGASTISDARASFSNFGGCVDVFAPGQTVLSAGHTSDIATSFKNGTSMASPHVAGVAALYLQKNGHRLPAVVAQGLLGLATAGKLTSVGTGSPNRLLYWPAAAARSFTRHDFDGDGRSDVAVYRTSDGQWYIRRSGDGGLTAQGWGCPSCDDIPVPANYTSAGRSDLAVYRATTGEWLIREAATGGLIAVPWGAPGYGDMPVPGRYTSPLTTDIAIYRPTKGEWYIRRSSNGGTVYVPWGSSIDGDIPVPADYDGDGLTDVAVYRRKTGHWFIRRSSDLQTAVIQWGSPVYDDVPVPSDYTVAGKSDVAVYRPVTGEWYIRRSTDAGLEYVYWGAPALGDIPVPANYSVSNVSEVAVYRESSGLWYIRGAAGGAAPIEWGSPLLLDRPLIER